MKIMSFPLVEMNIHADHREARGEASKKVREHPHRAQRAVRQDMALRFLEVNAER
jgi:hypothetical protein